MKEQERSKSTRIRGEKHIKNRKWPTVRSHTKMANAVSAGDKRFSQIMGKNQYLSEQLSRIYQPEVIQPKFEIQASSHQKVLLAIREASVGYRNGSMILRDITFHMKARERIAFCGDNGSGKSTLVRAILGDTQLIKTGEWAIPGLMDIGYHDQHYTNLPADKTVLDLMMERMPDASYLEIRKHLNAFLFRKNEEVYAYISCLSGGEKARLSLAIIAACPPELLILDELTNNLDLETRSHVIHVLQAFSGAMIVISHDEDFLKAIQIDTTYNVSQGCVVTVQSEVVENE